MEAAIQHLLDIQAIQPVPADQRAGILLHPICSPKVLGVVEVEVERILDLKRLNNHLIYKRFKMQSLQPILESIQFLTSIDLLEAYRHMPILPSHHWFIWFYYTGQHYQYRALPKYWRHWQPTSGQSQSTSSVTWTMS